MSLMYLHEISFLRVIFFNLTSKLPMIFLKKVFCNFQSLVGYHFWHLITGCHLCVGLIPTSDKAEDLSQYDPGCCTGHKTPTLTL